jgi:hypothetical protein
VNEIKTRRMNMISQEENRNHKSDGWEKCLQIESEKETVQCGNKVWLYLLDI